jgi:hypothetical protein
MNWKNIKTGAKALIMMGACAATGFGARSTILPFGQDNLDGDNPYRVIASRNIFDLHEALPQVGTKPEISHTDIKLTGISTVGPGKQALLIVKLPEVAGKTPKVYSVILGEGQCHGQLEVLEINPKARTVRIKNDGLESLLCFSPVETGK